MSKESIVYCLLVVLLIYGVKAQSKHKEFNIYDYSSFSNYDFGNFSITPPNDTHLGGLVYDMYEDLPNLYLQIVILNLEGNQVLLNHTLNFCKLAKVKDSVFLVRILTQSFLENLDFVVKCPFKKGPYRVKPRLRPLKSDKKEVINKTTFKARIRFFPPFVKTNEKYSTNFILLSKYRGRMEFLFNSLEFYRVDEVLD